MRQRPEGEQGNTSVLAAKIQIQVGYKLIGKVSSPGMKAECWKNIHHRAGSLLIQISEAFQQVGGDSGVQLPRARDRSYRFRISAIYIWIKHRKRNPDEITAAPADSGDITSPGYGESLARDVAAIHCRPLSGIQTGVTLTLAAKLTASGSDSTGTGLGRTFGGLVASIYLQYAKTI